MPDISAWFKEIVKDKVTTKLQAHGGLLDNTMVTGDTQANTVKFPIIGSGPTVYKLTGAIEAVPVEQVDLSTVQLTLEDFEATAFWRVQDAYKAGPSEKDALARVIVKSIRRYRDKIKYDALATFQAANAGTDPTLHVTTIGTGAETPDVLHFEQGRAEIGAFGDDMDDDIVFAMIPEMWMTQLSFYKEYADAQWVGPENAPFSKTQRMKMKTVRGITYIVAPDTYFTSPQATELYAWMWRKSTMGAETAWNQETPDLTQRKDLRGSPWQTKVGLGAAAIGILPQGVKRLHLKKITAPVRPS